MANYPLFKPIHLGLAPQKNKKKRKTLSASDKIYYWEHPKFCNRICNICGEKITKMSDLELDHIKPYSKGGTTLAFAHKDCNRRKGSGSLAKTQKMLGIKTKKRKTIQKKRTPKRKTSNPWKINLPKIRF